MTKGYGDQANVVHAINNCRFHSNKDFTEFLFVEKVNGREKLITRRVGKWGRCWMKIQSYFGCGSLKRVMEFIQKRNNIFEDIKNDQKLMTDATFREKVRILHGKINNYHSKHGCVVPFKLFLDAHTALTLPNMEDILRKQVIDVQGPSKTIPIIPHPPNAPHVIRTPVPHLQNVRHEPHVNREPAPHLQNIRHEPQVNREPAPHLQNVRHEPHVNRAPFVPHFQNNQNGRRPAPYVPAFVDPPAPPPPDRTTRAELQEIETHTTYYLRNFNNPLGNIRDRAHCLKAAHYATSKTIQSPNEFLTWMQQRIPGYSRRGMMFEEPASIEAIIEWKNRDYIDPNYFLYKDKINSDNNSKDPLTKLLKVFWEDRKAESAVIIQRNVIIGLKKRNIGNEFVIECFLENCLKIYKKNADISVFIKHLKERLLNQKDLSMQMFNTRDSNFNQYTSIELDEETNELPPAPGGPVNKPPGGPVL